MPEWSQREAVTGWRPCSPAHCLELAGVNGERVDTSAVANLTDALALGGEAAIGWAKATSRQAGQRQASHLPFLLGGGVIPSQQVEQAMDCEQSHLHLGRVAEGSRLADDRGPGERQIPEVPRGQVPTREGEHIGGMVVPQEAPVEAPQFPIPGYPDGQPYLPARQPRRHHPLVERLGQHATHPGRRDRSGHGLHHLHPQATPALPGPGPGGPRSATAHRRSRHGVGNTDNGVLVEPIVAFLHFRFAVALLLLAVVLGVWGLYQFLRRRQVSPGFRAGFLLMTALTAVQGLLGLLLLTVAQPRELLHVLYGVFAIVFLPGVYLYADRGRAERDERLRRAREAALLAGACWVVAIAYARGFMTGG